MSRLAAGREPDNGKPRDGQAADSSGADTQRRLEAAAVERFAEHGFHGTTTRDIARAAQMSPAGLYIHHSSKEELLYRISLNGHKVALQVLTDAAATSADPGERLATMMRAFVRHHARHHTTARILNYELGALSPEHQQEVILIRRAIDQLMLETVEAGVASGHFRTSNPRLTSVALLSLSVDVARWFRHGLRWSPEEIANHYCELALRMAGARTPPTASGTEADTTATSWLAD